MKCLSVRQPWASLIIGVPLVLPPGKIKDVENRTWGTKHRGPMAIHASARVDVAAVQALFAPASSVPAPSQAWQAFNRVLAEDPAFWRPYLGAIIGVVDLKDCTTNYPSIFAEKDRVHWVMANNRVLSTPVPYKGRLGLFDIPDELVRVAS